MRRYSFIDHIDQLSDSQVLGSRNNYRQQIIATVICHKSITNIFFVIDFIYSLLVVRAPCLAWQHGALARSRLTPLSIAYIARFGRVTPIFCLCHLLCTSKRVPL